MPTHSVVDIDLHGRVGAEFDQLPDYPEQEGTADHHQWCHHGDVRRRPRTLDYRSAQQCRVDAGIPTPSANRRGCQEGGQECTAAGGGDKHDDGSQPGSGAGTGGALGDAAAGH